MLSREGSSAAAFVAGLGLVISAIGFTDVILVWVPPDFGNPEWEFGTVSAAIDGMPLATIGLALVMTAAMLRDWRKTIMTGGIVSLLLVLALAASAVIYALDVPLAIRAVAPQLQGALKRAIGKTLALGAAYVVWFTWSGWFLLRRARAPRSS